MPWGAVLSAGASLVGGAMSADAAGKASDAQVQSASADRAQQQRQFDTTRSDNAQFMQTGNASNRRLAVLLGLAPSANPTTSGSVSSNGQTFDSLDSLRQALVNDYVRQGGNPNTPEYQSSLNDVLNKATSVNAGGQPDAGYGDLQKKFTTDDLNADPVYNSGLKFGLDQGTAGINARALQSGSYDSGATLKALTRFGNDYGSTKANDSYNRFTNDQNNTFNRLSGVSGAGQVATNAVTTAGTNATNGITSSIDAAGNARAAGIVGGANAWGSGLSGVGGAVNQYQNSQILQKLLAGNGGGGAGTSGYGYNGAAPYTNYYAQD